MRPRPYNFDRFFLSGLDPSVSPFLTKSSRKISKNLALKSSLFSLTLLILSFFIDKNISYLLIITIYFLMGTPAILNSLESLKKFNININFLMTLAAIISFFLQREKEGALLLVLFGLSNSLETLLSLKTKSAIYALNKISAKTVHLIKNKKVLETPISEVKRKDLILIKAGEIIPLDGIIENGTASINLKHITGESLPILKKKNDFVHAGAINVDGMLSVKVSREVKNSTLTQIIKLVLKAQKTKPKLTKIFDRFGKTYATSIILFSIFFMLLSPLILKISFFGFEGSIYRSLTFLIAASPCALIIAIPASYLSAISSLTFKGILIKKPSSLNTILKCKTFAFDKTGTLTSSKLKLENIEKIKGSINKKTALSIAKTICAGSNHPIARAFEHLKIKNLEIKNFYSIPGYGNEAIINSKKVFFGLFSYIEKKLSINEMKKFKKFQKIAKEKGQILSTLYFKNNLFLFFFSDSIKKNAKNTIDFFKKQNIETAMLTGDDKNEAYKIGKKLSIKKIYSNLRPKDKFLLIQKMSRKQNIAMVGDGINDAPALTKATIGIALGKISAAAAIDAADIVIINNNLSSLSFLFKKALFFKKIILQNLIFASFIILFTSILALIGTIALYLAVLLHEGSTLLVAINSLRLLKR